MFAHDRVELDVWMVEQGSKLKQHEIVAAIREIEQEYYEQEQLHPEELPQQPAAVPSRQRSATPEVERVAAVKSKEAIAQNVTKPIKQASTQPAEKPLFPYTILHVCGQCWKSGHIVKNENNGDKCGGPGGGHLWISNRVCFKLPEKIVLRPIPATLYEK